MIEPRKRTRCPICDEWYVVGGDRERMHDHPEPQGGEFRDAWLASKLPYDRWIAETNAGLQWSRIVAGM